MIIIYKLYQENIQNIKTYIVYLIAIVYALVLILIKILAGEQV